MDNKIQNNDIAFLSLQDAIEIVNENEVRIAEKKRELSMLEVERENNIKKARQYAANYFTKEKILELHKLNEEVLKSSDFDEKIYIEMFSDSTKIGMGDISFLTDLQNNIIEVQEKLDSNRVLSAEEQIQLKGLSKVMSTIADILLRKGGANND